MLHWEIDGKRRWLCRECTRINTHIFLQAPARLLAETTELDKSCSCCGRRDHDPLPTMPTPPPAVGASAGALVRNFTSSRWFAQEIDRFGELPFNLLHTLTAWVEAVVAAPARDRRALRRAK